MNSFNDENVECPICMECIADTKNRVTTECGHCFHTNCLMTSVAHNGFGCPYCRAVMAEEIKEEEDSEWGSVEDEDDEYALRGFRFMFNRLAGVSHDEQDILEENEDNEEEEDEEEEETKPSPEYITQKLTQQGVTMEQLVKAILINHEEYENEDSLHRVEGELFGKLRIIISNYRPELEAAPRDPPAPEPVQVEAPVPAAVSGFGAPPVVDYSSQPKSYRNIHIRKMMNYEYIDF